MKSPVIDTPRLILRGLVEDDADWVHTLNHDPLWLRYIGDRGVASLGDAHDYIARSQQQMHEWGFSILAIIDRQSERPVGMCGLLRRPYFEVPELGFALLPEGRGKGIGQEAARYVVNYAKYTLGFHQVLASVNPANASSIKLLENTGFIRLGQLFAPQLSGQLLYALSD
ncbi:GNAT family N-acetyltransferase [Alteromonas halophila]|uniref:N-acetyltransferase GCN5 n=1 Tax=Alteromonas halophila TaxID=516698 RepID=A0A918JGY5_9ALTE|nr:GNAT family N-acetyltransferase [Alteromonas halophila]GGW80262.1 N-acetyltransferase GCN5 [Alteromonas halophila]